MFMIRKYSLTSKDLRDDSAFINRELAISGKYGRKK